MTTWTAVYSTRKYLPKKIEGDVVETLEKLFQQSGYKGTFDIMTDQIEVRMNGRKIATYMAAE